MEKNLLVGQNILQRLHFQDFERFVTYFCHHFIESALLLAFALLTGFVVVETDAGQQGNGAIQQPDNAGKGIWSGSLIR